MDWAMEERGHTQRRACNLVGIDPRVYRCRSSRPEEGELRQRLRELAAERRRFGYRRLHLLLAREGVVVNRKKLYRLYKEEKLTVRKRGGRKRALGTAPGVEHQLFNGASEEGCGLVQNRTVARNPMMCSASALWFVLSRRRPSNSSSADPLSPLCRSHTCPRSPRLALPQRQCNGFTS